jgi:hypothetical protein
MTLVRIVKDWDWPDLLRQTPEQKGIWNNIQFTLEPVEECDYLVFLNNRMEEETICQCPKNNIWAIMQEPYYRGLTDWVVEGHEWFARIFTHCPPAADKKYVPSSPAIPWQVDKTFDQLANEKVPAKSKMVSWISGKGFDLPGHLLRNSFLRCIQHSNLEIDLFGRAVQYYIEDKWDGLAPYYYSIAIENNSGPHMWTEKLADCFLSWTIPFYFGCTNLEKYFPRGSFIQLDLNDFETSLEIIREAASIQNWESRFSALEQARNLVLYNYQLFPFIAEQINFTPANSDQKMPLIIPPYRRSLRSRVLKFQYIVKKKLNLL